MMTVFSNYKPYDVEQLIYNILLDNRSIRLSNEYKNTYSYINNYINSFNKNNKRECCKNFISEAIKGKFYASNAEQKFLFDTQIIAAYDLY